MLVYFAQISNLFFLLVAIKFQFDYHLFIKLSILFVLLDLKFLFFIPLPDPYQFFSLMLIISFDDQITIIGKMLDLKKLE